MQLSYRKKKMWNLILAVSVIMSMMLSSFGGAVYAVEDSVPNEPEVSATAEVPQITKQPAGVTVNAGETATFTVTAAVYDEGTLSYQWHQSLDNGSVWDDIPEATAESYTTEELDIADSGNRYRCMIVNNINETTASALSDEATLTVNAASTTADKEITAAADIEAIEVPYGTALAELELPQTVAVTLDDNSTSELSVNWDEGTPAYDGNTAGTYRFSGTLLLPDEIINIDEHQASVEVTVLAQEMQPELTALTSLANAATTGNWQDNIGDISLTGSGTEGEPYQISSAEELAMMPVGAVAVPNDATQLTSDTDISGLDAGAYHVTADCTLSGTNNDIELYIADNVNVTFSGMNIDQSLNEGKCAVTIDGTATITLLAGKTNTIKSGKYCAGINVAEGKSLTINGTGILKATGGELGAGIGGSSLDGSGGEDAETAGNITITEGTINATGGNNATGIGGGGSIENGINGGDGGTITISGGTVTAMSTTGIGGGSGANGGKGGDGGTIAINGGVVTSIGGIAGIGGGYGYTQGGHGGTITISGGIVISTAGSYGVGIGGGYGDTQGGDGGSVDISNGAKVYAGGDVDNDAQDIGGGLSGNTKGNSGTLTIGGTATKVFVAGNTVFAGTGDAYVLNDGIEWTTNAGKISEAQGALFSGHTPGGAYLLPPPPPPNPIIAPGTYDISAYSDNTDLVVGNGNDALDNVILEGTNNTMQLTIKDKADVTFDGVSIQFNPDGDEGKCAVTIDGTATITLAAGTTNTLKSGSPCAGINVAEGKSLTINGTGTLNAIGGESGAGIGGSEDENCGTVNISGCTVTAIGSKATGIGSGGHYGKWPNGGAVTISDGAKVYAEGIIGDDRYPDIGGFNEFGTLTISGADTMVFFSKGRWFGDKYGQDHRATLSDGIEWTKDGDAITAAQGSLFSGKSPAGAYFKPTFTVTYDANGGTGAVPTDGTAYPGTGSENATIQGPGDLERSGYEFVGWDENSEADSPTYKWDGTSLTPSTMTMDENKTLYAIWKRVPLSGDEEALLYSKAIYGGENGTELFLRGKFIELGISNIGDFGTLGSKPAGFRGTRIGWSGSDRIGMSADHDGFLLGHDLPVDYYLPGTPEERFVVGYKQDGVTTTKNASAQMWDTSDFSTEVVNISDIYNGKLGAFVTSTADGLKVTQQISFNYDKAYYKNTVTVTNNSGSPMDDVRYMRSCDPDNTQYRGGDFTTNNEILYTHEAGDGKAVVVANSTGTPAELGDAPIFFYSADPLARVSNFGFCNRNPYAGLAYDSAPPKGYTSRSDSAISITKDFGMLANGASGTFVFYTSLDPDFPNKTIEEIEGEDGGPDPNPTLGDEKTITFLDDDESTKLGETKAYVGTPVSFITDPVKSGKKFTGWSVKEGDPADITSITENMELVATYEGLENAVTVTFDPTGGAIGSAGSDTSVTVDIESGTVVSPPDTPAYAGKEFMGWTETEGGTDYFDFTTALSADKTLYAKWQDPSIYVTSIATPKDVSVEVLAKDADAALADLQNKNATLQVTYSDGNTENLNAIWNWASDGSAYDNTTPGFYKAVATLTPGHDGWADGHEIKPTAYVCVEKKDGLAVTDGNKILLPSNSPGELNYSLSNLVFNNSDYGNIAFSIAPDTIKTDVNNLLQNNPTLTDGNTLTVTVADIPPTSDGQTATFDIIVTTQYYKDIVVTMTYKSKLDIADATISAIPDQTYTGSALEPTVTVADGDILVQDTDYTVTYSDNINVGQATVTITGIGNYTNTKAANFTITQNSVTANNATLEVITNNAATYTYDLSQMLPDTETYSNLIYSVGTVTDNNKILSITPTTANISDGVLTLEVANVATAGQTATIEIIFTSANHAISNATLTVETTDKTLVTVTVTMDDKTYDGTAHTFAGTPTFSEGRLRQATTPWNTRARAIRHTQNQKLRRQMPERIR